MHRATHLTTPIRALRGFGSYCMEKGERNQINPWLNLWIRPRQTIRAILDTDPRRLILFLSILNGIISSIAAYFFLLNSDPQDFQSNRSFALIIMIIIGASLGVFHLYFGGWLYQLTGKWLGGKGTFIDLKCAVGWSSYLFLIVSLINLIEALVLSHFWPALIFSILYLIFIIWSFIAFIFLIAEAHRFSAWRGLGTLILALALVFVAVMITLFIITIIQPLFK